MIFNLKIIFPEIFLTLSIFTILMIGVFVKKSFKYVGLNYKKYLKIDKKLFRPSKTASLVGNINKAKKTFKYKPKTNLDQFATGLNGTRSPYGACSSAFNSEYVSGGSSSGSALSVAKKQVCFSLGTDTGGSGRIPAAPWRHGARHRHPVRAPPRQYPGAP